MLSNRWTRRALNLKHIVTIIAACILSAAAMFLFSSSIKSHTNAIGFLNSRNYNYSVLVDKKLNEDTYSFYDSKVTFSKDSLLNDSIPASVLMRLDCDYTKNDVLYNKVELLNFDEVIVSDNIASKYRLKVGNSIFSKNKINNNVCEFHIKDIIPDCYSIIGLSSDIEIGIIIFGYDEEYLNSVQSSFVYLYENDYSKINDHGAFIIEGSLTAKKDQVTTIGSKLGFEFVMTILLCLVSFIVALLVLLFMNIKYYRLCKEYGDKNTYRKQPTDFIFYCVAICAFSTLFYSLSLIFKTFTVFELIISFASICIAYLIIWIVSRRLLKGDCL